jgi:uncharacterized protein YidB (DUF937 family)
MGLIESMMQSMSGGHGLTTPALTHAMRGVIGTETSPGPGLPWLLETLEKAGLGDQVRSWTAAGGGMPISGAQLRDALGDNEVRAMSSRAGLLPDEFVAKLSEHLPGVVRALWRDGNLPGQARAG